jgi:NDP-sugar pyrophosphorylase family protein
MSSDVAKPDLGRVPGRRSTPKKAVILAGGKGARLAPYTTVLPKPLLPIGDHAILEVVVDQLRAAGFDEIVFAVGHLAHLIRAVFQNGENHGVSIEYHHEKEPLGTAGALATMQGLDETFLMMNGDILTALDYGELFRVHRQSGNALTIATHQRTVRSDYGVLDVSNAPGITAKVTDYREKPETACVVSMGVYVVEPVVRDVISANERLDFPDLVLRLLAMGARVGSYQYDGYWLDIGRPEDYQRAVEEYEQLSHVLRPPAYVAAW